MKYLTFAFYEKNFICLIIFTIMKHFLILAIMTMAVISLPVNAWSNGGWSADKNNPDYGTHDWIAEHSLDLLPEEEKKWILENKAIYLYGTEIPDDGRGFNGDGIGDTEKHHVYFNKNGSLKEDPSGKRALTEFNITIAFLQSKNYKEASLHAGIMSHYISDLGVYAHTMGKTTDWGEEKHHSDYEDFVKSKTTSYNSDFNSYLEFDGNLEELNAYNGTIKLAYDSTFGRDGKHNNTWMDVNYDWNNAEFKNRVGESLNFAVNILADVLHTVYLKAFPLDIISTPITKATIGEIYTYDVQVRDETNTTYKLLSSPEGMKINSTNGMITWNPNNAGNFAVVIQVKNGNLTNNQSFTITVEKKLIDTTTAIIGGGAFIGGTVVGALAFKGKRRKR